MGVIKGVLKEELENSYDMLKRYQEEIAKVKGCLIRKKIGKRYYYYLVKRQGKKVKFKDGLIAIWTLIRYRV